jgi:hypothetical protein
MLGEYALYGKYPLEKRMEFVFKEEKVIVEKSYGDTYLYQREKEGRIRSTQNFSSKKGKVNLAIYPVRPIQVPQLLAHNIMIKLDPSLSLPPGSREKHFLTMPIEIGVFVTGGKNDYYMIDVFSLIRPKFALYGQPDRGYICNIHKSGINSKESDIPFESGVVIMRFKNLSNQWVTINKIVMDAYMMDYYLKGDSVYLEDSSMVIDKDGVSSILLNNKSPLPNLKEVPMASETVKNFRLGLLTRKGFGISGKFIMEHGY